MLPSWMAWRSEVFLFPRPWTFHWRKLMTWSSSSGLSCCGFRAVCLPLHPLLSELTRRTLPSG